MPHRAMVGARKAQQKIRKQLQEVADMAIMRLRIDLGRDASSRLGAYLMHKGGGIR